MSFQTDHKRKLDSLKYQLSNRDELKRSANGGNTTLFTFPPNEEEVYIELLKNHFQGDAEFIDLGALFAEFIDSFESFDEFEEVYKSLNPNTKIFKSDGPDEDLFNMVVKAIKKASTSGKIPILTHVGSLYATEIENQNIMEDSFIMQELQTPLVIMYPSTLKNDELYFLGIRKANKYRCTLVE